MLDPVFIRGRARFAHDAARAGTDSLPNDLTFERIKSCSAVLSDDQVDDIKARLTEFSGSVQWDTFTFCRPDSGEALIY